MKHSYVFAGASLRALDMYMVPIYKKFPEYCDLRGVFDINPGRARDMANEINVPVFNNFEEMIVETKPEFVIVTTVDAFHCEYIIKSMELGCDVITEKPMAINHEQCAAILEAEKRTGKKVIVTFNYRYAPFAAKIKELISSGEIGEIFSIHFEWMLDRNVDVCGHGTSYFRRWNARMKNSGGLLVHKSTHHFDIINWWLGQKPLKVSAFAKLNLYGERDGKTRAGGIYGENCRKCSHTEICPFYYQLTQKEIKIYAENEKYDGYYKDGCVFAPDIDIYDTMSANIEYDGGALTSYSLNATCAYEGWRVSINGSNGRLEAFFPETGPDENPEFDLIKIYDLSNNVTEYKIAKAGARDDHNGGDERLHQMLFVGGQPDPLGFAAGSRDGAASVIIGAAANLSIRENRTINISELIEL